MARQMINHRGPEFGEILGGVTEKLKQLFKTKNDIFLLTGSGTGGLEAAIVNILSPGDRVLSVSIGVFGERFATIAQRFGVEVIPLRSEWGKAADADAVRQALRAEPGVKAVLVTHNETSTGVTNDLAAISAAVKEFDKLLVVDAISSLGSIDLPVDQWHCDVTITGSQKGEKTNTVDTGCAHSICPVRGAGCDAQGGPGQYHRPPCPGRAGCP